LPVALDPLSTSYILPENASQNHSQLLLWGADATRANIPTNKHAGKHMVDSRSALIEILDAHLDSSRGGVAVFYINLLDPLDPQGVQDRLTHISPTATISQTATGQFAVVDGHRNVVAHAALTAGLFRDTLLETSNTPTINLQRVSVGVAIGWPAVSTAEALLDDAESACASAASRPGSYTEIFDDSMRFLELRRIELATALGNALESNAIDLQYQPTVELATSRWVSLEAYLRWIDREQGWVPPMDIIPAAERADLAQDLVGQVIDIACKDLVNWQDSEYAVPWVSINVSPGQLALPDFHSTLLMKLSAHGLDAHRIGLDIPASALTDCQSGTVKLLQELSASGISLTLDNLDESTLQIECLQRIDFQRHKLDPQFVSGLDTPDGVQRLRSVLELSEKLSATAVVKGVETQEQLDTLTELGVSYAQGFLFARPQAATKIELSSFKPGSKLPHA
jgi:EAL domain-containing protein (putative c-di-GMP-specific phosphodiesterase class I)